MKIRHTVENKDLTFTNRSVIINGSHTTDLTLTLVNNDIGFFVSESTLTMDEGASDTYTVGLGTKPSGNTTVTPSFLDTSVATVSPASHTFTTSNWSTPKTFTVTGANDDIDNATNHTTTLAHSHEASDNDYGSVTVPSVTVAVTDDDVAGLTVSESAFTLDEGATATYTVVLHTQPPTGDARVSVSSSATTAATASPTSLTFTSSNWKDPQTVTVRGVDDDYIDPEDRRAKIRHRVSGYHSITRAPAVPVTVRNDDVPSVTVFARTHSLRDPIALVTSENDSGIYRVVLDKGPLSDVTIAVASADPTVATAEPVLAVDTLTFTRENWNRVQEVVVRGVNDDVTNPRVPDFEDRRGRTTRIVHTIAGGGYDSVTVADAPVFVQDDDHLQMRISTDALTLDEGSDQSAAYTLRLTRRPTGDVTVRLTVTDPDEAIDATPITLTFTPGNWRHTQAVTVRPRDNEAPGARTARIAHKVTGGGYEGRGFRYEVTVTVTDDDGGTQPPDPDGGSQDVSVSPSGLVTWTHDPAAPEDEWYFVEWIAGTRPPASMEWGWGAACARCWRGRGRSRSPGAARSSRRSRSAFATTAAMRRPAPALSSARAWRGPIRRGVSPPICASTAWPRTRRAATTNGA